MNSLVTFNDTDMNFKAIVISSILITKISFEEKSSLFSNNSYVKTLLDIVESYSQQTSNSDDILRYTLELFLSLTDESPKICETFLKQKGLNLFLPLLEV
jgi:hypothetical protein